MLTELNAGGLGTDVLPQSSGWSDATKPGFSAWPANITGNHEDAEEVVQGCILQSLIKVGRVSGRFALLHLARADWP
jgi:hypothetical protein